MPRPPHIEAMKQSLADYRHGIGYHENGIQSLEIEIERHRQAISWLRTKEAELVHRIHEAEEIESW